MLSFFVPPAGETFDLKGTNFEPLQCFPAWATSSFLLAPPESQGPCSSWPGPTVQTAMQSELKPHLALGSPAVKEGTLATGFVP